MKIFSLPLLAETVLARRKSKNMTQAQLAQAAGMNRSSISKLESKEYTPSLEQLQALAEVLDFDPTKLFTARPVPVSDVSSPVKIAVAGTGYVGLSLAVLLSQHNPVKAVDIVPERVEKINQYVSPIQDEYIEKYLAEAREGTRAQIGRAHV